MSNVVIKVIDSDNNLDFEIPIKSNNDSPLSIDKQLTYLEDLSRKGGVISKNIEVPISKEIADSYNYFFEAQHYNYKDVDSDKDAVIIVDGNELERGKVRIVGYNNKNGNEELKLLFFGNNFGWTELIKEKTLSDINFNTSTINYTPLGVKSSFFNSVDNGQVHVFPLENRGGRELANQVHTNDFRPALFLYSILEWSLKNIGYTFESNFMNTTSFKRLIVTFFGKRFRYSQSVIEGNKVVINNGLGQVETSFVTTSKSLVIQRAINLGNNGLFAWNEVLDDANNFDPSAGSPKFYQPTSTTVYSGTFTAPKFGIYKFKIKMNGDIGTTFDSLYLTTYAQKSTDPSPTSNDVKNVFVGTVTDRILSTSSKTVNLKGELEMELKAGEVLEFHNRINAITSASGSINSFYLNFSFIEIQVELLPKFVEGASFEIEDVLDDKIKVLDIINDVSRLFNLVWDADVSLKKITVEPRNDYYGNISDAIDVTDRLDLNSNIYTSYNSKDKNRNMVFSYATDSNDGFVKGRNDSEQIILGEYKHNLPNKFKEGTTKIVCKVLAPSYPIKDIDSVAISEESNAPWTTRYWNEYSEEAPEELLENHLPRLLNYHMSPQSGSNGLNSFRFYDETTNRTLIPYCLPHQIKIEGTIEANTNYNLYFNAMHDQDGLFADYWSKTITEIIEGKNIEFKMLFDQKTWSSFSFRKVVYISDPIDVKGYWIVEKLGNYQPENSNLVKVRALKRIEYQTQTEGKTLVEVTPIIGTVVNTTPKKSDGLFTNHQTDTEDVIVGVLVEHNGVIKQVTA